MENSRQKRVQVKRDAINRAMTAAKKAAGISRVVSGKRAHDDALRLMETIPRDTRSLTAMAFGDPLPGRSALDRRQA